MRRALACGLACLATLTVLAAPAPAPIDEPPAAFARFEPMVGGWKGTARPAANKVRGWPESHSWAWKFAKGVPVGMTLTVQGGKVFTKGDLSYDPAAKTYKLDAVDPAGKPVAFVGPAIAEGKPLVLDRVGMTPEGKQRITIRPNGSGIRYTMLVDNQAAGSPQYKNAIDVGLTKEGESFAAGGGASDLPKCVITGGSATMTVSFEGKSYPICCTGCRDEFADNPAKYIARAKAAADAKPGDPAPAAKPAPKPSRGGDEFDGLLDPKPKPKS